MSKSNASGLWEDAGNWGIILVDLARHVANAYEHDWRGDYFEVLGRIRELFDAEWDSPNRYCPRRTYREPAA